MQRTGFAGRTEEVARALAAFKADSRASVLVNGPAGIGKSRLVDAVCADLGHRGWHVVALAGAASSADLPLGAWSALLPAGLLPGVPLAPLLRQSLTEAAGGRPIVLAVDDANLLDDASAALVGQLWATREVALIVAQRGRSLTSGPFADIWRSEHAVRIELGPLMPGAAADLAAVVIGHPLAASCAQRIASLTRGNPLYVVELSMAALEADSWSLGAGGLATIELPDRPSRLSELVHQRLAHLTDDRRALVLQVALGEPIGPGEMDGSVDDLVQLESAGLLSTSADAKRVTIRLAHPLYGEVLRRETSALQRRAVLERLTRRLASTGARRREDPMRLAAWSLEGGADVPTSVLAAGAARARFSADLDLAEQLAAAAYAADPGFDSGWILADVLYARGAIEPMLAHLESWSRHGSGPDQAAMVALSRAVFDYWHRGNAADADAVIDAALAAGPGDALRDELVAVRATLRAVSGRPADALTELVGLGERGADRVLVQAALATAHAHRSQGHAAKAISVIERAVDAYGVLGDQATLFSSRVLEVARIFSLAHLGELAEAEARASEAQQASESSYGLFALTEAFAMLLRGRFAGAAVTYERAVNTFAAENHWGMQRWALAGLTLARSYLGDHAGAAAALAQLDALGDHPARVLEAYVWMARAWVALAASDPDEARRLLAQGAADCRSRDDVDGELACWYQLSRLGAAADAAERVSELVVGVEGELLPAMAAHVAAAAACDGDALVEVSDRLAALGADLWAAEAAATAADELTRAGQRRRATAAVRRAAELRGRCDAGTTPALAGAGAAVPLTRREREIALLAAQGVSSRAIGERLFVSARTVESHLARVYTKLGVRTRSELARVLDGGVDALTA